MIVPKVIREISGKESCAWQGQFLILTEGAPAVLHPIAMGKAAQGGSRAYRDYSSLHPCVHPWPQSRLSRNPALDSDQRVQHELRKSYKAEGELPAPASSLLSVQLAQEFPSCV